MKKTIFLTLCLFVYIKVQACDICGCQLSGLSFGMLAGTNSHYIGIRFTQAQFNAAIRYNGGFFSDEFSNDTFIRTEILGRYILSDKFQVHTLIPYIYNEMRGSSQNLTYRGIGDPSLLIFYDVFAKKNKSDSIVTPNQGKFNHTLLIGGGVKFPVGDFDRFDQEEVVNRNFQIGTGSIDFLLSGNYTLSLDRWGINTEASYKINTRNPDEYKFGNQFNSSAYLFYAFPMNMGVISPYAGVLYESSEKHDDNGIIQNNTGGNATLATLGFQINWKNLSFNALYQDPIDQNFNSDNISEINAEERFSIGILYNFKRKTRKKYGFQ